MKGFPKHLNTKADYEYIRRAFPESQWKPCWQALLDSAYDWFTVFELESKEIGEEIEGKARVLKPMMLRAKKDTSRAICR